MIKVTQYEGKNIWRRFYVKNQKKIAWYWKLSTLPTVQIITVVKKIEEKP